MTRWVLLCLLLGGCAPNLSSTVTVETTKVKAVEVSVEPFDICARTDGELSPLRMHGHAMDSKPYGCM